MLCAGAPDTPEIAAETARRSPTLRGASAPGVVWIEDMLPRPDVIQLLTHATVFVCPSVYEPLGIVNLEAMACETAVVASATSAASPRSSSTARPACWSTTTQPTRTAFERGLAEAVNALARRPGPGGGVGVAGRAARGGRLRLGRVAAETVELYQSAIDSR